MRLIVLGLLLAAAAIAQQAAKPSVVVTWTDTANPTGTTYSVIRTTGATCPNAVDGGVQIATGLTAKTFTDKSLGPGAYCYTVMPSLNGVNGPMSDGAPVTIPLFKVTGVQTTITVQVSTP